MKLFDFVKRGHEKKDTRPEAAGEMPKEGKGTLLSGTYQYAQDYQYAYKRFKEGKPEYADELQKVFLFADAQHMQRQVAQIYLETLQSINTKQLIRLSEDSRRSVCVYGEESYYHYSRESWEAAMREARHRREQFSYLTDAQYVSVLCMGTFHSNGYYREMCLTELHRCGLKLPSTLYGMELSPLSFYLLRVNDWVPEIRNLAKALAMEEIPRCGMENLLLVMPTLEKIRSSCRREQKQLQEIEEAVRQQVQKELPGGDLSALSGFDINNRNAIYLFLQRNPVLSREELEWLLQREKTGYGKKLLFAGVLRFYDAEGLDLEKFLGDRCADIRYEALNYKYARRKDSWAGLDAMLLDSSAKIRGTAGFILRRHENFDLVAFYLHALDEFEKKWREEADFDKRLVYRKYMRISLLGIGENSGREKIDRVKNYMEYDDAGIVRAAMQAYGMIMREQGSDIYWEFLLGDSPEYTVAAYKLINQYHVVYDAKELYENYILKKGSPSANLFLALLLRAPSWRRLEYLLLLYDAQDIPEYMRDRIREQCCRRDMYARLSASQVERLKDVLERKKDILPERLVKEILFDLKYAG